MPSQQDVLDAFDALGGNVNQPMALQLELRKKGFDPSDVVSAINSTIASGVLVRTPLGGIEKT